MSILIPPTPASNKSTEQHQEPSEQGSFNHLLYMVLRLTSQQVQDLNGRMEHQGIPNVHEVIAQNYRKPHTLKNNLKFISQGKTCYIQSNVMFSLSLMISYIKHRQCYFFQHANHTNQQLVDHGANGGLAGSDMHVIHRTYRKINIQGIDNHEVTGLDVVTAATLLNTPQGKVIGIFNEYAYFWKGSSIHSSGQLEWFQTNVDETSVKVGGTQLITTLDGYSVPLCIKDGLPYATSLGKPTDQDMDTYPHVFITSPDEWDPSQVPDQPFGDPMFDAYGDFNEPIIANLNTLLDEPPGDCGSYTEISPVFTANLHQSSPQEPDWNTQRPFLAWTSPSSIKDTFNVTTRHGTAPNTQDYIKKHFKSRNPVFSISRCSEAVATDTIFSDTPAVDDGPAMAQFFCGHDTLVCDAYGIKSTRQFVNILSDNSRMGSHGYPHQ